MSPPSIDIASVQRWRKLFIAAGLFALLAWTALVKAQPQLEHPVEHLGLIAIMVCVLGRAWCSLYIGGRKKQEIVTSGPYSGQCFQGLGQPPSPSPAGSCSASWRAERKAS